MTIRLAMTVANWLMLQGKPVSQRIVLLKDVSQGGICFPYTNIRQQKKPRSET